MQLSDITPGKTYRLKHDIVLPGNDVLARKGQQARVVNCSGHGEYVVLVLLLAEDLKEKRKSF